MAFCDEVIEGGFYATVGACLCAFVRATEQVLLDGSCSLRAFYLGFLLCLLNDVRNLGVRPNIGSIRSIVLAELDFGYLLGGLVKGNVDVVEQLAILMTLRPLQWKGTFARDFALGALVSIATEEHVYVFIEALGIFLGILVEERDDDVRLARFLQAGGLFIRCLYWVREGNARDLRRGYLVLGIFRHGSDIAHLDAVHLFNVRRLEQGLAILKHVCTQDGVRGARLNALGEILGALIELVVAHR